MLLILSILLAVGTVDATGTVISKPPSGPKGDGWITTDDYPKQARRGHEEGVGTYLYRIGVEGKVDDCRTVTSAGFTDLDEAACKALQKHVRFSKAAEDAVGKPVPFWATRTIHWRAP